MGVIPLGISLLRDVVDTKRLGTSIALVSATLGVGGAIGLPLSAAVTENLDWHWLFVFAVVLSAVCFVLVLRIVPASSERLVGKIDFLGALGLAVTLSTLLLAVSQGNQWGWTSIATVGCLVIGLGSGALLFWYELRVPNPLIDIRINALPAVLLTNLASVAMGFALFASSIAFPQLLGLPTEAGGLGIPLLLASLTLMPSGLAMLAMSPVAGRLQARIGPRPLFVVGAAIIAFAYLLCLVLPLGFWAIAAINTIIGIGIGLGYAAMPALIMAAVPRHATASANGLNTLMRSLGTTAASAIVGAILAAATGNAGGNFSIIFGLGFGASTLCAILAAFIPTSAQHK